MSQVRVIKRYSNRKLYCTSTSKYVTLSDITQMVCLREDVMVIDNRTKRDITADTLTQAIHETEILTGNFRSVSYLRDRIAELKNDGPGNSVILQNQQGFGLVEVMITLGIMSVVMLGLMQVTTQAMLVSSTADQKNNLTSIVGSTTGQALNEATCTAAITKTAQTYGANVQFNELKSGAVLPQYALTVNSLTYENAILIQTAYEGTKAYYGVLTLSAKSNKQVLGSQAFAPRTIAAVYFKVDPAGKVVGCGPSMPVMPIEPVATPPDTSAFEKACHDIGGYVSGGICKFHGGKS